MQRRDFLGALFCAPAIVKAENIMKLWVPKVAPVSYAAALMASLDASKDYWIEHIGGAFVATAMTPGGILMRDPFPDYPTGMELAFPGVGDVIVPPGWKLIEKERPNTRPPWDQWVEDADGWKRKAYSWKKPA